MLCAFSRWMISRAEDTGEKLPGLVARHIGLCPGCGAFARSTMALAATLRAERSDVLSGVPEFAVDLGVEAEPARPETRRFEAMPRPRRLVFGLRPLPAAAAALVLVAAGAVIYQSVRREAPASPQDLAEARAAIKTLTAAPGGLEGALEVAESSLDKERRVLEKSLVSAVDYLQARLNITIERKDRSKSL